MEVYKNKINNELKRIISAIILIPLVIYFIYYTNEINFIFICAIIFSLILKEWIYITHVVYSGFVWVFWFVFLASCYWLIPLNNSQYLLYLNIFWLFLFFLVCTYPKFNICQSVLFRSLSLMIIVFGSFLAIIQIDQYYSHHHLLFLLIIVWATDIGSYIFGKKFGELKLAPFVSPNKTIAGVAGGFIFAITIALVLNQFIIKALFVNHYAMLIITLVIIIACIFGDLVESMFKRQTGVKDSGHIIPGHGGILDRTDSLLTAIPFYLFALNLIDNFYH